MSDNKPRKPSSRKQGAPARPARKGAASNGAATAQDAARQSGEHPAWSAAETVGEHPLQPRAEPPSRLASLSPPQPMPADVRTQFQANIGEVAVAMANMPRYRDLRLGDLIHILVEPMLRHRVAIAKASSEGRTMGVAIWASVSREVDADIRQQVQAGVFPIRLKQEDWNSGDSYWLLDLIAPTQAAATAVLASFRQVVGDNPVHMHPMVSGLVDPQVLSAMRVRPQPSQAQAATPQRA